MKNFLKIIALIILVLPKGNSQNTQNIIGVSLIHGSNLYKSNSIGIGVNIERYHSKIKYLSYGINAEYFSPSKNVHFNYLSPPDGFNLNTTSIVQIGGRLALHLQKGKFDFYAGGQLSFMNERKHYMYKISKDSPSFFNVSGYANSVFYSDEKYKSLLFGPFVGMRYHPIKNLGIQIEGAQQKTSLGNNVKF